MGKRRILQIDGGGIKGIIPLASLVTLESSVGEPLHNYFDLMSGTSTGAIITGMLAAGVPARKLYNLYTTQGEAVFKKWPWWKRWIPGVPKYDRSDILAIMSKMVDMYGDGKTMGDVKTKLISTTFNGVSGRTHFQMSWLPRHAKLDLVKVISWSATAAVHYFGPIEEPEYKYKVWYQENSPVDVTGAVFYDGGQGRNNCTLSEVLTTALKLDWLGKETVEVLSLGCGAPRLRKSYKVASGRNKVQRLMDFVGQAHKEFVHDQLSRANTIAAHVPGLTIHRIDPVISSKHDKLDGVKYIPEFIKYGRDSARRLPEITK